MYFLIISFQEQIYKISQGIHLKSTYTLKKINTNPKYGERKYILHFKKRCSMSWVVYRTRQSSMYEFKGSLDESWTGREADKSLFAVWRKMFTTEYQQHIK